MLRFALCADDYALTPGVSRGILELLRASRLSAVSVMSTQPGWPEAARELRPSADRVDIGLHFNLTLGAPLGRMPHFAPAGEFPALAVLLRAALGARLPLAEIGAELIRQIDAFGEHFGSAPAYIDGHQHVHALPGVRTAVLRVLAERGLAGRLWLRDPADGLGAILSRPSRRKALAVAALSAGFARKARALGFRLNEGFSGFSDFDPDGDYPAAFAGALCRPGPRHLIMCHPGYADAALARLDPATQSRDNELAFFSSARFSEILNVNSAQVVRLSALIPS